jgi:hypothetical protein
VITATRVRWSSIRLIVAHNTPWGPR